ncbi:MAG: 2-C-methyl-D-erythritol 4-phosphate cytidylyltransferase [Chloroflexi bacterium]|nr:MAG: 2-C-methyl-D-erythritol 4-phosphate cytidylyltransferase [Chloroflexota bacterium]
MTAAAIIVAGGQGSRMQGRINKVFIEIDGRSILERSLQLFQSSPLVKDMVLVARAADLAKCDSFRGRFPKLGAVVAGGDLRHSSEFAGIRALAARIDAGEIDTVLVHDAVRPFASGRLIERLLAALTRSVGCVPGVPLDAKTVQVDDGWISGYPRNLWAVQTPQAFQATWLLEAHNKAARQGFIATDTASVVEWAGGDVAVIDGEADNIKITTPADLARARQIAAGS